MVKIFLILLLFLAGCGEQRKPYEKKSENKEIKSMVTEISHTQLKKKSTVEQKKNPKTPKVIQTRSKIYSSLQKMGITANNLDFFFHSDRKLRELMHEKLINTRDPYHLHLVWQKIKQMLDQDQWKEGFDEALTVLWNSSDQSLRNQIINHLLVKPKLSKTGRTPWMAGKWLLKLSLDREYDLQLLKILKINQHHSRPWVRNYLSKRYRKNFGSNYLIWKQYLEQN